MSRSYARAVRRLGPLCLALLALASTATAATIRGSPRGERLVGTARADSLHGLAGNDVIHGLRGGDFVDPGAGRDVVRSGHGPDRISLETDGAPDRVLCGPGRDIVTADERDGARGSDCEVVTRRIARDPFRTGAGQHATIAEPDSHASGSRIVSVFQVGRHFDGGAMDIGFATFDGTTWRTGRLPGVGVNSSPAGRAARVSDPVVAYDAAHGVWLAATLALSPAVTELLVSRSPDGIAWSLPVVAASEASSSLAYDKEWITCDSWPASPRRGHCYLSYTEVAPARLATRLSTDGGQTWSPPSRLDPRPQLEGFVSGAQPVVRPDGTLVVVHLDERGLAAARSLDGGRTFTVSRIAGQQSHPVTGMRAPPLPSADVAGNGTVYVAWHDCQQRPDCRANDIVLASSPNGRDWSPPRRLPLAAPLSYAERFLPALAAEPEDEPAPLHRLALLYYSMPTGLCDLRTCRIDVWYAESNDGGENWRARQLNARSMRLGWIADTNSGRMLADYVSVTLTGGAPVPVFTLASPPVARRFRQALYTTRLP